MNYYRKRNLGFDYNLTGGVNFLYSGNLPLESNLTSQFSDSYSPFSRKSYDVENFDPNKSFKGITFFNLGAFAQSEIHVERFGFQGALRYDHHDLFGDFWNPRLGVNYKFFDNRASLRASYNQAHKIPTTYYMFNSFDIELDLLGGVEPKDSRNPNDLKAEKMQSVEVGFIYSPTSKFIFDFVAYYNEIKDVLDREFVFESSVNQFYRNGYGFVNNPLRKTYGVKTSMFSREFFKNLGTKISLSINYAEQDYGEHEGSVDPQVFNIPLMFFNWVLTYRLPLEEQNIFLELNNIVNSSYNQGYVIRGVEDDRVEVDKFSYKIPASYRLNLEVRYVTSAKIELFGRLQNLLDTRYGGIAATNGIDDIYVNPQKGLRYQFGVSYRVGRNSVLK